MDVQFTDGATTFVKTLKIVSGGTKPEEVAQTELESVATFYVQLAALPQFEDTKIPKSVSNFQFRAALLNAKLYADFNSAIQKLGELEQIAYGYSPNIFRDSPLVVGLIKVLGLSDDQIDQLFIDASGITV